MASRTRFLAPALALSFAACVHKVVYLPAPGESQSAPPVQQPVQSAPEPVWQPAPAPAPSIEPLEVTIGRPVRDRFILQTSRPAYVAIFEVVPGQGVTMMRPASVHETYVVSGIGSVRAWWTSRAASGRAQDGAPTRYLYAIASDEPLHITEASFQPGYLRRTLGSRLHGASDPYATMRALSRHFVPAVAEEAWGEDAFVVPGTPAAPARVARVYCPDGSRHEVPADMADRVRCGRGKQQPGRRVGHGRSDGPVAPDSIVGDDDRHVRPRVPTRVGRGPIDRVSVPTTGTGKPSAAPASRTSSPRVTLPGRIRVTLPSRDTTASASTNGSSGSSDKAEKTDSVENVEQTATPTENRPAPPATDERDKDKGAKAEKAEKPEGGEKADSAAKKPRPQPKPLKRPS